MKKFIFVFLSLVLIINVSLYSYNKNKKLVVEPSVPKVEVQDNLKLNEGINLMALGKYEEAIEIFKSIPQREEASLKIKECYLLIENKKIEEEKIIIEKEKQESENKRQALLKGVTGTYKLLVDTTSQEVYIYKNNAILKTMTCSTGIEGKSTPKGNFTVTDRGNFFYSDKYSQGAYYWVRFYGVYLFHSLPTDKNGNILKEEAAKLGQKASHGCVRVTLENAKWIYDNIPKNISKVIVY